MHVVTKKHLVEAEQQYRDAAKEIRAWHQVVKTARWRNFTEVRQVFKDADAVDDYLVFNIRGNRYRLITIIHASHEDEQPGDEICQGRKERNRRSRSDPSI